MQLNSYAIICMGDLNKNYALKRKFEFTTLLTTYKLYIDSIHF